MAKTRRTNTEDHHTEEEEHVEVVDETDLSETVRLLKQEMAAMKQQREKDAKELSALKAENEALKNQDSSWKPTHPTTTQTQGSYQSHEVRTSVPHGSAAAPEKSPSTLHTIGRPTDVVTIGSHRHPFTSSIMQLPLLDNWKSLPIDKYDGTTDPDEHLDVFLTQVTLSTTDDAALCQIFPTSLKGRALSWFTRLPPNSIDSFNTLSSQFTIQFATSRPHSLTSLSLVSLRQDKKESLRAFMDRFNKAALEIRDLNSAVALHHLTTTLKPGPFVNSICKKPPSDMNDLRRRVDKYMQMVELAEYRNQARAESVSKAEKPTEQPFRGKAKEITLRDRPTCGPKYSHYTPLNASRAAVLEQALAAEVLAGQLHNFVNRSGSSRPRSTYQPRHQDRHRHDNSERTRRDRSRSRDRKDDPSAAHRRVINTIAGGFAGGGSTSSAQKRHLRAIRSVHVVDRQPSRRLPTIIFTDADFQGIDPVQDDPMVISVEIHNFIVKKTLVDQGSSADILYWNTFKQLGISETELIPYDDPLVGFSGERVSTKGYIKLFTRFCFDEQESREIQVKYIVVHANTSYNILLGRPSLNMLGAIVSTPHLAMKFPSDKGKILTIHADQKAARECYFASLRVSPVEEQRQKSKRVHAIAPSASDALVDWDLDPRMNNE
ncbi:uncharacterized protein LOC109812565 [Cajanus cajan]|uniref:uncharacterized protein LOC109812565 n=1 Tax=Cajanus cajan TaxID=3821 RepID=UPI00098DAD24|nr:uncharacterized protein LOC109812565 [Cajanus cajan]